MRASLHCAILLFTAGGLLAQGTGTIHGVVTDPAGLAVPGAAVTASLDERGTTRSVITGAQGDFVLPLLPVGTWSLRVEGKGFKQFSRHGLGLTSNQNVRVDAKLEVGSVAESVNVTAEAVLIDSRSSQIGTLIDSRRVLELPTNGRNVIALAELLPGVAGVTAPQEFTGDRSGPTVNVSGTRNNQNLFLFDGQHFNAVFRNTGLNYPPPDALQEVKVLTSSFSAEYGRNAGAIFNVVTKAGTNQIHGSAWEFLRNHKLNARNFFAPSVKPQLIQNQFGAAAGGPIRKDKLFIFGSYEGLRVRPASLGTAAFPLTDRERAGDFSTVRTALRDPLSSQPFPDNQIPTSRFDTVARNLISPTQMPLPNRPGGQLVTLFPTPQNDDQFLLRVDHNLRRHTIDGRYNYNLAKERDSAGQVPTYLPLDRVAKVQSITVGDTFSVTPALLNQARLSYNRVLSSIANLNPTHISDLGGVFPLLGPKIPPNVTIAGRVDMGNGSSVDATIVNESTQFDDTITWTHGRHTVKGGFEYLKLRYLNRSFFQTMGGFTFSGQITGDAAADFLIGRPASMTVASPVLEQAGLQKDTYYFIQDDWHIHPRLTLNVGLRYELMLPWVHPNDFWGTLHLGEQSQKVKSAPVGLVYPGDPGVPRGLIQTDKNNFAPRIGFAWDPLGNGRMSIRGGYGIFFEQIGADIIQNTGQPFRYTFTYQTPASLTDPFRGQPPIPLTVNLKDPVFTGLQQIFYPDPGLRTPYVQHVSLNVQREVARDLVVQVGYVGKIGRKQIMGLASNPALFAPGATLGNLDQRRIVRSFGSNTIASTEGNLSYNALQVEVNKRFSRGFSVQGAYTFSRALDMASANSIGAAVPYVFNLHTQWGLADFHSKHIASFSWIWDLPKLQSMNGVVRGVAGGWQVNGLVTLRSGRPLNMLTGADTALSGTNNQRPNVIGDHELSSDRSRGDKILAWFNRAAFASPLAGAYGNVGRNALIGPGATSTNLGLFKNFAIPGREGLRLQFRSELFNVMNGVNLGSPNTSVNAGARLGLITSASGSRVIQFALKVLF